MSGNMPIKVLVAFNLKNLPPLTYIYDGEKESIIGKRVLCALRRGLEIGYCVGLATDVPKTLKLKSILAVMDDRAVMGDSQLKLANWMSDYYMSSLGAVCELFSPRGLSDKSKVKVRVLGNTGEHKNAGKLVLKQQSPNHKNGNNPKRRILEYLSTLPGYTSMGKLAKDLRIPGIGEFMLMLEKEQKIEIEYGSLSKKPRKELLLHLHIDIAEEILFGDKHYSRILKKAPKQKEMLEHLYHYGRNGILAIHQKQLVRDKKWNLQLIRELEKKSILTIDEVDDNDDINESTPSIYPNESTLELSQAQKTALYQIEECLAQTKPVLLYGDTGSGKTLLYIKLIEKAISRGEQSLVLLPEISLTPQMLGRFKSSFPGRVEIIHSRLTERERFLAWHRIKNGDVDLVIGPRSSLFAPLERLGLIIVDEEHESSYKQENPEPRYQARDVAVKYASDLDIEIVLGSATPSVESMYKARSGRFGLVRLEGRISGVGLPEFQLIDMVEARKQGLDAGHLSRDLAQEILKCLDRNEGVILFQNKRGYSNVQECTNCGHVNMCPHCSISLTLHYGPAMLRCHLCGYSEISTGKQCKECKEEKVELLGTGTQLLEDELRKWLKEEGRQAKVERLDSDTTVSRGSQEKILSNFSEGEIDILIGTQMIAKGLDIGRVTLVGVVNADMQLYIPDFRGSERLYQLLVQVGGRAGRRKGTLGKVYIQTYNPRELSIQSAINSDYEAFYSNEVNQRQDAGLPPFRRLIKIEVSNKDKAILAGEATKLHKELIPIPGLVFFSIPITPSIEKVNDRYRKVIIAKSSIDNDKGGRKVRARIREALLSAYGTTGSKSRINIDIDTWSSL